MVFYVLLSFNIIGGLISMFLNGMLGAEAYMLTSRLASGITNRILAGILSGGPLIQPAVEYLVYVAIATAASVVAFHRKEMEF
jgi:hypothetical protein